MGTKKETMQPQQASTTDASAAAPQDGPVEQKESIPDETKTQEKEEVPGKEDGAGREGSPGDKTALEDGLTDPGMEVFNKEDASFATDRYTLIKPFIISPTADFQQFGHLLTRWKGYKQYYIFIMIKTGISEEMVKALITKVRARKNAKSDSDMSFIAALSVLTGNDFLHKAYPTFEECYSAQALRGMVRDYYNGPTREDRTNYEEAMARADISLRAVEDLKKQLEKYLEIFLNSNIAAAKREESIRADYRAMMEKDRTSFEKQMELTIAQKDRKIKELEEANRELRKKADEDGANGTNPDRIAAILKERDHYANEVQRLMKEAEEKEEEINSLKKDLQAYQDAEKENEIKARVKAELEQKYEAETAKITAQKEKEIEKKDEELLQAKQMISCLKEAAATGAEEKAETEENSALPLTKRQLQQITEYVMDRLAERDERSGEDVEEENEEEILQELMQAREIYDSGEEEEYRVTDPGGDPVKMPERSPEHILPHHSPPEEREDIEGRKTEKPPRFFRKHWKEQKEKEEIEDIGFSVIASDEFSDTQKNLIQEAIDSNISLKNLRRLADPSIPEKNLSQALHYFLRKKEKAS